MDGGATRYASVVTSIRPGPTTGVVWVFHFFSFFCSPFVCTSSILLLHKIFAALAKVVVSPTTGTEVLTNSVSGEASRLKKRPLASFVLALRRSRDLHDINETTRNRDELVALLFD